MKIKSDPNIIRQEYIIEYLLGKSWIELSVFPDQKSVRNHINQNFGDPKKTRILKVTYKEMSTL